ncbi:MULTISPECIES: cupin domain-containing protein [unclassified Roseitalea]|uniref:cupin domain-containing protein n=1 Tax=unclassified Roseitalea TaxID=2639107 RepID=UPI00273D3D18|nr:MULTISPECIES: cupin domain-containing protein [unclassified Roseitalea]
MNHLSAADIRALLDMRAHPEGGWYVETFRDTSGPAHDARGASTAIYFLLEAGEVSHWHRVSDASEVWHHYAGAPLRLALSADGHDIEERHLGTDLAAGERPQIVVPAGWWQSAAALGAWTLVGCTVAPGFDFAAFELAPPDWQPTMAQAARSGSR